MTSANITTKIEQEVIIQETEMIDSLSGIVSRLTRSVVDTQDSQMRQALIALGWTPPPDADGKTQYKLGWDACIEELRQRLKEFAADEH